MVKHLTDRTKDLTTMDDLEVKLLQKYVHLSKWMTFILSISYKVTGYVVTLFPILLRDWYLLIYISLPHVEYIEQAIHKNEWCFFSSKCFSYRSHPGYEIGLLINIYISYYALTSVELFDRYFYYFSFFVVMRLEYCTSLVTKIGDFNSEYNSAAKQQKLLRRIVLLHQDIHR